MSGTPKAEPAFVRFVHQDLRKPGEQIVVQARVSALFRAERWVLNLEELEGLRLVDVVIEKSNYGPNRSQLPPTGSSLPFYLFASPPFSEVLWDTAEAGSAITITLLSSSAGGGFSFEVQGKAAAETGERCGGDVTVYGAGVKGV